MLSLSIYYSLAMGKSFTQIELRFFCIMRKVGYISLNFNFSCTNVLIESCSQLTTSGLSNFYVLQTSRASPLPLNCNLQAAVLITLQLALMPLIARQAGEKGRQRAVWLQVTWLIRERYNAANLSTILANMYSGLAIHKGNIKIQLQTVSIPREIEGKR